MGDLYAELLDESLVEWFGLIVILILSPYRISVMDPVFILGMTEPQYR
jgi:hypothetical protein